MEIYFMKGSRIMNELILQNSQIVSCEVDSSLRKIYDCQATKIQLNEREQKAIALNYNNGLYDIASEVIWRRTMDILKERVAIFGDDFIGDMLGYDKAVSVDEISERDVIELNNDVGFIKSNAKMEMIHHSEQIKQYTSRDYQLFEKIEFDEVHAKALIADCINYVLSDVREYSMLSFSNTRTRLKTELLSENAPFIENLRNSEYFEKRTILRSLINLAKTEKDEEKQIIFHNMRIVVPSIWDGLAENDKFSFGTLYAEISNTDKKEFINAVKTVLITVHGFDYVPENLKSSSFINSAKNLLNVHYGINNFYNEPMAAKTLSSMGTMIPDPALFDCVNAVLICLTGNGYGVSDGAVSYLNKILDGLTLQKWELFFKDLSKNKDLLYQFGYVEGAAVRWAKIFNHINISTLNVNNFDVWTKEFLEKTAGGNSSSIRNSAKNRYDRICKENESN